jgi:hypothetical protein
MIHADVDVLSDVTTLAGMIEFPVYDLESSGVMMVVESSELITMLLSHRESSSPGGACMPSSQVPALEITISLPATLRDTTPDPG